MPSQTDNYSHTFSTPLGDMDSVSDDENLFALVFTDKNIISTSNTRSRVQTELEKQLQAYFKGELVSFSIPTKVTGTVFQNMAWQALQQIPFGQTRSYLEQAQTINKPKAFRAVANANAKNPISILIPCHRIINHNGKLGGYAGGIKRKQWLLEHEKQFNTDSAQTFC